MGLKLHALKNVHTEILNEKIWVDFYSFKNVWMQFKYPDVKKPRFDNIKQSIQIEDINGFKCTPLADIISIVLRNRKSSPFCLKVCQQMESRLCDSSTNIDSVLELYKSVIGCDFFNKGSLLHEHLWRNISPQEVRSVTLFEQYKEKFCEKDWQKICLFEYHFAKRSEAQNLDYENQLEARSTFLERIRESGIVAADIVGESKKTSHDRKERRQAGNKKGTISLFFSGIEHLPSVIEDEVRKQLELTNGDDYGGNVSCVDCTNACSPKHKGLHLYIEIAEIHVSSIPDMVRIIRASILRKHSLSVSEMKFFKPGSFLDCSKDGVMSRFYLRDSILAGTLDSRCLYVWTSVHENEDNEVEAECVVCNKELGTIKPLHWSTFDLEREWLLDVPIQVQCILQSFINRSSLERTDDKDNFIRSRLSRIYMIYDNLMNILNRSHWGILQEMNTAELMVNYRSLTDAFQLTHGMGVTMSLDTAESRWKDRAQDDLAYYNYAIRRSTLQYETDAGISTHSVSLRDCFKLAMRDNLVTTTEKSDPLPGETRSGSICTIQGTDIGVPKNSKAVSLYHYRNGCDGVDINCICLQTITLGKDDMDPTLTQLSADESHQLLQFQKMVYWSSSEIWNNVLEDETLSPLLTEDNLADALPNDILDDDKTAFEDLETSMHELQLDGNVVEAVDLGSSCENEDEDLVTLLRFMVADEVEERNSSLIYDEIYIDSDLDISALSLHDDDNSETECYLEGICPLENEHPVDFSHSAKDVAKLFGFERFIPPPFITRHTLPWIGRDDDPQKIAEICNDLVVMTDAADDFIILGLDQKIAACHQKLKRGNKQFDKQILEVPVLHLLKHKVVNLCSAYKEAGLLQILKFMRDDDKQEEWARLVSIDNIRKATRMIKRLAIGLAVAFQVAFIRSLPSEEGSCLLEKLTEADGSVEISDSWHEKFEEFLEKGRLVNATFALHFDMLQHALDVGAIFLSERIGGPNGYHLLRACAKRSLAFSFTNGASSYAAFITHLLAGHSSAPPLIQSLKMDYFSVPYEGSGVNFGLDTIREEDHRKCKKLFRPGANVSAITRRMKLIDELHEINQKREECLVSGQGRQTSEDHPNWMLTQTDVKYIVRVAALVSRRGGLSSAPSDTPLNVYTKKHTMLSMAILDNESDSSGKYLLLKHCKEEKMFNITNDDIKLAADKLKGPKELISKVLKGNSKTINRAKCKPPASKTAEEKAEQKRQKILKEDQKRLEGLYSEQNTCQAVVNAGGSKYKVMKSVSVPAAVISVVGLCLAHEGEPLADIENALKDPPSNSKALKTVLQEAGLIQLKIRNMPAEICSIVKIATTENAGVPYKVKENLSGDDYIRIAEDRWIKETLTSLPNITTLVLSEEKYGYTPDLMKSATRAQRQAKQNITIDHLKTGNEIVSQNNISKSAITSTSQGKKLISTFLPKNVTKLTIKKACTIIFDSELIENQCSCCGKECTCVSHTTPLKCTFSACGLESVEKLDSIQQRKGEAEMAQIDWMFELKGELSEGDGVMAVVSSADIDAVVLHLFAVSLWWPRLNPDGHFSYPVYVQLRKAGYFDIYNITGIIECIERAFGKGSAPVFALSLCLAGNDFLPRYQMKTHSNMVRLIMSNENFRRTLFQLKLNENGQLDKPFIKREKFVELMKVLYCPKSLDANLLTFEDVRQLSIKPNPGEASRQTTRQFTFSDGQASLRHPKLWLPPKECLEKLATLVDVFMEYIGTLGQHDAILPNFGSSCLVQKGNKVEYDLGKSAHVSTLKDLLHLDETLLKERKSSARQLQNKRQLSEVELTPGKGPKQKRRVMTSTPAKSKH